MVGLCHCDFIIPQHTKGSVGFCVSTKSTHYLVLFQILYSAYQEQEVAMKIINIRNSSYSIFLAF